MNKLTETEVTEKELELINRDSDHLAHFGIAIEKVAQSGWWVMNNTELNREVYGICRLMVGESEKKVRIVIDYDADYPFIVTRVYKGDNLRGE